MTAVSLPEAGNYGAFTKGIWGLEEGAELTVGATANICVPAAYIEARKAAEEEGNGSMKTITNLQIVLDKVPDVRKAYGIEDAVTAEDWVELWGADLETMETMLESAKCVGGG